MKRLLVFHPIIAPYRIDFFNYLNAKFCTKVYLTQHNLTEQIFNYEKIEAQMDFQPTYIVGKTLGVQRGVISALRREKPEIVLVPECGVVAIMVILYKRLTSSKFKIISMIDDSYDMVKGGNQFSKRHAIAEKILIPCFDNVITIAPNVANFFQEKYGKGISFPIIPDEEKTRMMYEQILPISEQYVKQYQLSDKKVLLFVGRLVEIKNLQRAIPAFMALQDNNARFIIVGSGNYEGQLKKMAHGDNRVLFVGRYEGKELYAWYNIAHCFILPSYQEAFGAVTTEALIGGCPVIISEKAGSSCLIENGKNGSIIPPYNVSCIYKEIHKYLEVASPIVLPLRLRNNLAKHSFKNLCNSLVEQMKK